MKRTLSILLALVLLLCALPLTAVQTSAAELYPLWIDGSQVGSKSAKDILDNGGDLVYDNTTHTLTLSRVQISGIKWTGDTPLTITGYGTIGYGTDQPIYSPNSDLVIDNANLIIESENGMNCIEGLNITICDSVVKTSTSRDGISAHKNLKLVNSYVFCSSPSSQEYGGGIVCYGDFSISGGNLNITTNPSEYAFLGAGSADFGGTVTTIGRIVFAMPMTNIEYKGAITFSNGYSIVDPEDGYVEYETDGKMRTGAAIRNWDGSIPVYVNIDNPSITHQVTVEGGSAYVMAGDWMVGDKMTPLLLSAKKGEKVALSLKVSDSKAFKRWEVVSGDVTIVNPTSEYEAYFIMGNTDVEIKAVYEEDEPTDGAKVFGTVTSYLNSSEPVTVTLYQQTRSKLGLVNTKIGEKTVYGNSAAYSFTGLEYGNYRLDVSKKNHVTRSVTFKRAEPTLGMTVYYKATNVTINPIGDIDGNGRITVADAGKINNHIKKINTPTGYEFDCADADGNGKITVADAGKLNNHIKKKALLW